MIIKITGNLDPRLSDVVQCFQAIFKPACGDYFPVELLRAVNVVVVEVQSFKLVTL
jgi:hypothetical protein